MIRRINTKSCCGSKALFFETDKPIKKSQIQVFKNANYSLPDYFYKAGIFYVQLGTLVANSSYGATRISVRCGGPTCDEQLKAFESLLETAINS